MDQRVTPGFFYGSAMAALVGLLAGLVLHGPWESHPGGPQIWFSSAAAEELAKPIGDADLTAPPAGDLAGDAGDAGATQLAELDAGYVEPSPLPVIRLRPERFDVRPASANMAARVDDDLAEADAGLDVAPAGGEPD